MDEEARLDLVVLEVGEATLVEEHAARLDVTVETAGCLSPARALNSSTSPRGWRRRTRSAVKGDGQRVEKAPGSPVSRQRC